MAAIEGGTSGNYMVQWHGAYRATTYKENIPVDIYTPPFDGAPRLYANLVYSITRPGGERSPVIRVHLDGKLLRSSLDTAYYGYRINIYFVVNGQGYLIATKNNSPSTWGDIKSSNGYDIDINWASNDRLPINISIDAGCLIPEHCPAGNYTATMVNASVPNYVSRIDPTPQTDGAIYSTNNTSGSHRGQISDKPDTQIWFDWWGQNPGTVGFKGSNIDISKTNSSSAASSIALTQNYTQNKKLSLFDIAKAYGAKVGDTLYCWVNTQTMEDVWLGRQYLGAIKLRKDGKIQYKDSNGVVHEVTKVYYKDSNGTLKKARYARIKDSAGTTRVIDVYTTLYE